MKHAPLMLLAIGLSLALVSLLPTVHAQATTGGSSLGSTKLLGAGLAFGLAALGAGFGLGQSGAAAIAAVVEKPEVRTTALIFVALAEAIAIYGFVMAIIILGQAG